MVGGEYRKNESPGIIEDSEYEEEEEEEEDEEEEEVEEVNDDEVTQSEEGMGVADTEQGEGVQEDTPRQNYHREELCTTISVISDQGLSKGK